MLTTSLNLKPSIISVIQDNFALHISYIYVQRTLSKNGTLRHEPYSIL